MSRKAELIVLLLADTLALIGAYMLYMSARFDWQWFGETEQVVMDPLVKQLQAASARLRFDTHSSSLTLRTYEHARDF